MTALLMLGIVLIVAGTLTVWFALWNAEQRRAGSGWSETGRFRRAEGWPWPGVRYVQTPPDAEGWTWVADNVELHGSSRIGNDDR